MDANDELAGVDSLASSSDCGDNKAVVVAETRQHPDEGEGAVDELKSRLEETTVILRMALNNEFVRALEICSQR